MPPMFDSSAQHDKKKPNKKRRGNEAKKKKSKLDEIELDENSDDDSFGEDMRRIKSSTGNDVLLKNRKDLDQDSSGSEVDDKTEEQK